MADMWRFISDDRRYALEIPPQEVRRVIDCCRRSRGIETGGILLGLYSNRHDCAMVTRVVPPPPDSTGGRAWFVRGVRGLQRLLDACWKGTGTSREYYLGEWHYHPEWDVVPSSVDVDQMAEIAASPAWNCPEPVLLIIGRSGADQWTASASVFRRHEFPVALHHEPGEEA